MTNIPGTITVPMILPIHPPAAGPPIDPAQAAGGANFCAPRVRTAAGIWLGPQSQPTEPTRFAQASVPESVTSRSSYAITGTVDPAQTPGGVKIADDADALATVMATYGLDRR